MSMPFQKLVIASGNQGKLREIQALLAPLAIEVIPQSAFNVPEAEEPFVTFIENALAKARRAYILPAMPASPNPTRATTKNCYKTWQGCMTAMRITIASWCWCAMRTIRSR